MLIVDSSCLADLVVDGTYAAGVRARIQTATDFAAPHIIDVEVLNVIRRMHMEGRLDETASMQAIESLHNWPGERHSHRDLLWRAWQLRHNVRGWDAFYVALAEAFDAPLITRDRPLSRVKGLRCSVELVE